MKGTCFCVRVPLSFVLGEYCSAVAAQAQEDEERPPPVEFQPEGITGGEMREYQLAGLRWLVARWDDGVNAILADEMVRTVHAVLRQPTACLLFVDQTLHFAPEVGSCCLGSELQPSHC